MSYPSSNDGESPKSAKSKESHDYVNMTSPRAEIANPALNYAEIDFTKSTTKKNRPKPPKETVPYAVIDIAATQAANEVIKAHHQQRESAGPLRRTNSAKRGSTDSLRRVKERKGSATSFRDRQGSSSSGRK